MLNKRIIPCLDVAEGRVVKGQSFVNLRDAGDPVELAKLYSDEGADELVFLDITASHEKRGTMLDVVYRVANEVFIPLTVGGGINTPDDIKATLRAGADKVSINTAGVNNPEFIREAAKVFGSQCIVVAIDAKSVGKTLAKSDTSKARDEYKLDDSSKWEVYTSGGRVARGIDVVKWARYVVSLGAGEILLTSMDRDGQASGYDIELTRAVAEAVCVPVIASGGAGKLDDIRDGFAKGKAEAALIASMLHYKQTSLDAIREYLSGQNIPVRKI